MKNNSLVPGPGILKGGPGILKVATLDESLHNTNISRCSDSESLTVSFHKVVIREYKLTVGDNPSCTFGPPISIGWHHDDEHSLTIDKYEDEKGERQGIPEMFNARERFEILKENGVPKRDIARAVRDASKTRNQRTSTNLNLKFEKVHTVSESARRKVKRFFSREKRDRVKREIWTNEFDLSMSNSNKVHNSAQIDHKMDQKDSRNLPKKPLIITEEDS